MNLDPSSAAFFEQRYQQDPDFWGFATNPYELQRYRTLMQLIGPGPFAAAYEPACSVGVFTEMLAPRCDQLLATDPSPTAVAVAAERCASQPHVKVVVGGLPDDLRGPHQDPAPPGGRRGGPFDLIVFSEVGYYFELPMLEAVLTDLCQALRPHGVLVGTHWTGRSNDHRIPGEQVHAAIDRQPGLLPERGEVHQGFLLGRWRRR